MLEKITHIEGLSAFENMELYDDTPPGAVQIRFFVKTEEMPFLSAEKGEIVTKNFVHIEKVMDLGRSVLSRRIRDTVEWDKEAKAWKVKRLAVKSDIKTYPNQWNAFAKGMQEGDTIGIPLSLLFKSDPSRAAFYAARYITTVEQLAEINQSNVDQLGLGARGDQERAKIYLEKVKANSQGTELTLKLEEKDKQISSLQNQLTDLSAKLTELLERQGESEEEEPVRKRGRPRKVVTEDLETGA
jgi:hypothetical protein